MHVEFEGSRTKLRSWLQIVQFEGSNEQAKQSGLHAAHNLGTFPKT